MTISFVASGTKGEGLGSVTPGLPAGWQQDDIFLLHIEGEGEDGADDGQGDFGGTLIGSVASQTTGEPSQTRHTLYWKRAGASESAPTVSDAGQHTLAVISAWRGCIKTGSPIHKSASNSTDSLDTSHSNAGVTTTIDNCMIVASGSSGDDNTYSSWANANLDSITEGMDEFTQQGSDGSIHMAYGILSTAGASGTTTATVNEIEREANWCLALKPATGPEHTLNFADDLTVLFDAGFTVIPARPEESKRGGIGFKFGARM